MRKIHNIIKIIAVVQWQPIDSGRPKAAVGLLPGLGYT